MSDVRLLRGFPRQAADRADRHRRIFQGRSFAGKIHQRLPELLHAEFGRRHARRRQLRHHRGETDVELPLPTRLELLAARRLEQQHMELRLLHQHLPRTDARSAGRERSGLRPLRGYGALLAGMELFRTGEDLRRSALVRPRRPLRQRGRPLQAPRQPRIRHGARARRPQLRLRTLLHLGGMGRQPEDQPLHRTGHQVAHLPLRGNLPQIPPRRSVDGQGVGSRIQQGQQMAARGGRCLRRADGGGRLLARQLAGRRGHAIPFALHVALRAQTGGDVGARDTTTRRTSGTT